jgi:hypothetical protein
MKRLLLALLVTATAILAAGHPPTVSATDCLVVRYFYYPTPSGPAGGPSCGRLDIYCNDSFNYGCQTEYYTTYRGHCICP